ncbi:hypothetical protein PR202_ga21583 [Eleusine coracana subsp. coracana]|uniref:RNA methyltransferase n=1 Tax=Eleusine coracana subsp. coracana TaxID=191504 RepID=A0AAV5D174_ELECO|nr:hypothetical protein PR202_ga21583 [Eleusine coracana subsp. coracana]
MAGAAATEDAGPAPSAPKETGVEADMKRNDEQGSGETGQKRKKRKEVFIYGNYRNYYGYRIDRNVGEDPRLEAFKKEWFEGKDCLDIGCNQGLVTIGLAMKFECRSILGVDIDSGLIETAKWNLRRISRLGNIDSKNVKSQGSSNSPSQSQSYLEEVARENFNVICIYPEKFREILLDKVGFRSVEMIADRLVGTVTGFDRPIEVYRK